MAICQMINLVGTQSNSDYESQMLHYKLSCKPEARVIYGHDTVKETIKDESVYVAAY